MAQFNYKDGFPLHWGNLPQDAKSIAADLLRGYVRGMSENQIPSGREDQIPMRQIPRPQQAQAQGMGIDVNQNLGSYGSNLYDAFMIPVVGAKSGTP